MSRYVYRGVNATDTARVGRPRKADLIEAAMWRTQYEAGATTTQLGHRYGLSHRQVAVYIRLAGGELRRPGAQKGKK